MEKKLIKFNENGISSWICGLMSSNEERQLEVKICIRKLEGDGFLVQIGNKQLAMEGGQDPPDLKDRIERCVVKPLVEIVYAVITSKNERSPFLW
ncbi:MAG TPA: hypothetical protein P5262_00625 [Candidatus Moranbacteria bacterium]|nr:hypothetical protein [Candidatus Moranbacteria bacterium]